VVDIKAAQKGISKSALACRGRNCFLTFDLYHFHNLTNTFVLATIKLLVEKHFHVKVFRPRLDDSLEHNFLANGRHSAAGFFNHADQHRIFRVVRVFRNEFIENVIHGPDIKFVF